MKERYDCSWHSCCEPDFDLGFCDLHEKVLGKDGFWCDGCKDFKVMKDAQVVT